MAATPTPEMANRLTNCRGEVGSRAGLVRVFILVSSQMNDLDSLNAARQ